MTDQPEDYDEDPSPMAFTEAEREKMIRIGGIAGYLAVCRDRMAAAGGFNSVAFGELQRADNDYVCKGLADNSCTCDRTSGKYPSLAKNPNEHLLKCPAGLPLSERQRLSMGIKPEDVDHVPVYFTLPYRTATITGICKLDHEHNGKDCKYERAEPTAEKPNYRFPICCRSFERECGQGCICHTPENKSCPVVGCPIPYCDGAHAMSGPSTDKHRRGFEFL